MALIDKASLLMVPSTYEAGTLYNVLPSGNRAPDSTDQNSGYDQTRADFTFDRGSNAAATRIDENGVLQKYRENVLTYSNVFNQGYPHWATSGVNTPTSGESGYDGSTDAWLLERNAANGFLYAVTAESGVNTFSVYAKANTADFIALREVNGYGMIYFDLSDGTIGASTGGNVFAKSIESVGNGWYRCSIHISGSTLSQVRIYPTTQDGSTSGTSGSIYIQNAQLESGLVSTDYLDSGATTAKAGVLIDLPRINYDANGENGALLLEPSRLNVIPYSEYFSASDWTKSNVAVIDNATTSPEGVQNAALVYPSSSSSTKWGVKIEEAKSGLTNSVYTNSIYIKPNGWRWVYMIDPSGLKSVWFDLQEGVVGTEEANATGDIEPMSDGWYKCTIYPHTSPTTYIYSGVYFSDADNSYVCTASGTNGVYLYGAQSEAGSYPTSYIPNHGESGGVTRAADFAIANDVDTNQSEGTLFVDLDIDANAGGTYDCIVGLGDGTSGNRFGILRNDDNTIRVYMVTAGASEVEFDTTQSSGRVKIGFAYKANDAAIYVNGVQEFTDSSFAVSANTKVAFNQYLHVLNSDTYTTKASIRQTALFNERLSNSELATLTTL